MIASGKIYSKKLGASEARVNFQAKKHQEEAEKRGRDEETEDPALTVLTVFTRNIFAKFESAKNQASESVTNLGTLETRLLLSKARTKRALEHVLASCCPLNKNK